MKKQFFFQLSVCTFCLFNLGACNSTKEVKISLPEKSFIVFGSGTIEVPLILNPQNIKLTAEDVIIGNSNLHLSSSSDLEEALQPKEEMASFKLVKLDKEAEAGKWKATIDINGAGNTGSMGFTCSLKGKGFQGISEEFKVNIKAATYSILNDIPSINPSKKADWNKDIEIDLTSAYEYFNDDFTISSPDIHLYNPHGEIWGESEKYPAFCIPPRISDNKFIISMILDESDKNLEKGIWYWIINGKVKDKDVQIKVELIINYKK